MLTRLGQYLFPRRIKESDPATAYDIWSQEYDYQPDNLMLALDEQVFAGLLDATKVAGKAIIDIGCGTGRHWKKILGKKAAELTGYDVSEGMLGELRLKYPGAGVHLITDEWLPGAMDASCDLVISTLTLAHIPRIELAFREWRRVLRPGGEILVTDYHPEALARGGQRTFKKGDRVLAVRNHIHSIEKIKDIAAGLGFEPDHFEEREIDESVRNYYETQDRLLLYEKFYKVPIIYGMRFKEMRFK